MVISKRSQVQVKLLVPWVGPLPKWFNYFVASCRPVKQLKWALLTDQEPPDGLPSNIEFHHFSLGDIKQRIEDVLGFSLKVSSPYKLCDWKVTYGEAFADLLDGFPFFGWGDIDLIIGDLDRFLSPLLERNRVISTHQVMLSNHLAVFENKPDLTGLFRSIEGLEQLMSQGDYASLDDRHLSRQLKQLDPSYFEEHYTTPFVDWMTWTDGTSSFPRRWFWTQGHITNDLDRGYEFPYFHFMVWKGGRKSYYSPTRNWDNPSTRYQVNTLPDAFEVSADGFTASHRRHRRDLPFIKGKAPIKQSYLRRLQKLLARRTEQKQVQQ